MTTPTGLIINGNEYDFASAELTFNGVLYTGVKAINYREAVSIGKTYGTSRHKRGRTGGQSDPTGDIEWYREEWNRFLANLGPGFGLVQGQVIVSYSEPGVPSVSLDTLVGVRIIEADSSNSEGPEALTVRTNIDIMRILWNGQTIVTPRGIGI